MPGIFRRFFIALAWLLTAAMPTLKVASQVDSEWTILDVTTLPGHSNLVGNRLQYLLSPDGSQLVWIEAEKMRICVMSLPSQVKHCRAVPEQYLDLTLQGWSPNSQYLLLRDGVPDYSTDMAYEPKMDTYHVIEGKLIAKHPLHWDMSVGINKDSAANPVVYFMTMESLDYSLLHNYSIITRQDDIFDPRTVFDGSLFIRSVLSLDGTRFVFSLEEGRNASDVEYGLWLVNIITLNTTLVVSLDEIPSGLTERESSLIGDMMWNNEDNHLLVPYVSWISPDITHSVSRIHLETGEVTPLLTQRDAFELTGENSFAGSYLTPDGQFLFYFDVPDPPPTFRRPVFVIPLSAPDLKPYLVTEDYMFNCPRSSLLVTIGHKDGSEARRYLYQPRGSCP